MKKFLAILAAGAFASAVSVAQAETDFPNKPVTFVVPFAAGGPTDSITRILADELSKIWNQQVLIENKAGGATVIGTAAVARAKPDGYTLIQVSGSFVANAAARSNLPYDPVKDFTAVAVYSEGPLGLVAAPGFVASTLPELIEEAKKRPDRPLTYASAGVGSTAHLAAELVQQKVGIRLKHIAYPGEAAAIPDILSGRVDFYIGTWANQRPYVDSQKMKLISILYPTRLPEAQSTPVISEVIKDLGVSLNVFNAVAAPAGTPRDVIEKLGQGIKAATASKGFQDRIQALGAYVKYVGPEDTDAYMRREIKTWTEITKAANIRLD
jgi:tripartite-type tricarboxylate transporter receptor subunit TctC